MICKHILIYLSCWTIWIDCLNLNFFENVRCNQVSLGVQTGRILPVRIRIRIRIFADSDIRIRIVADSDTDTDFFYADSDTDTGWVSESDTDTDTDNYPDPDILIFRISGYVKIWDNFFCVYLSFVLEYL